MMPDHAPLLARLAAATGPDPALDREVALALGWRASARYRNRWAAPDDVTPEDAEVAESRALWLDQWIRPARGPWYGADMRWPIEVPPMTACTEAATCGLPGGRYVVGWDGKRWNAFVAGPAGAAFERWDVLRDDWSLAGATPALAICAARVDLMREIDR